MSKNAIISTQNDKYFNKLKAIVENEGFYVRRTSDGDETAHTAREHLSNVAIVDIETVNSNHAIKGIKDVFSLNTYIILCYETNNWHYAKKYLDDGTADCGFAYPINGREVKKILAEVPESVGFDGNCRVTFVDPVQDVEHQTPNSSASLLTTPDFETVVVLGEYVPSWVNTQNTEIVVGRNGELLSSFKAHSLEIESSCKYGLGEQYWFAEDSIK